METPITTMLSKFSIEYSSAVHGGNHLATHRTDDPIEAEDFLMKLLMIGARVLCIRHDGEALTQAQSDRMIKIAAERLAAGLVAKSLDIDLVSVKHRFGFAV